MKIKQVYVAIAVLIVSGEASAQPDLLWSRSFGGGAADYGYSVVETTDGGYAMAGTAYSFGAGENDFWLVRSNSNGDSLWSRTYGGGNYENCNSLIQTDDGGFAMAGLSLSFGVGEGDFWLVKTNTDGDSLWSRTFGRRGMDDCFSLIQTEDGGFAMAGVTYFHGVDNPDFWLVRTNSDGDSLWSRTFDGGNVDACQSLIQTADGGFALVGITLSFGPGDRYDSWLIRTDERGDSPWSRTFRGVQLTSLIETNDGGFAMGGSSGEDCLLVKANAEGDSLWSRAFGGEGNDNFTSILQTAQGGLALAGYTTSFGAGENDFWLLRTNDQGDSLWSQSFGGGGYDLCHSLIIASDGGFVMAGETLSFGAGEADFFLVKTTPDPTLSPINVPEDCETIQQAVNWASDGDTILVAPGTYAENLSIDGKSITILGDPENPENVVIDGNGGGAVVSFVGAETDGAKLEGFTIKNASGVQWGEGALWGEEAGNITLSRLLITNIAEYVFHSSNTIFNVDHATIRTVSTNGVCNATVVNLTNSIVRGFTGQLIRGGNVSANYSDIQGGYEGEGNIDADPRFLDPDNGDFRLHRGSPCVNTGDPNSPPDPDGTRADMGAYPFDHTASHQIYVPEDFATIQPAIDDALNGDTILVAPGTYTENLSIDGKSISIIGDPENPENVVIDGGGNGSVVFIKYVTEGAVTLDGLTLRNGNGTAWHCTHGDNHFYSLGGGLLVDQAGVAANNLYIRNCAAMEGGGFTAVDVSDVRFNNVHIDSTTGWSGGSAIVAYGEANIVWNGGSISNDVGFDNDGEGGYRCYGMAFLAHNSRLEMNHVLVTDAHGAADTAIYLGNSATASLDRVTFVGNDWPALVGNPEQGSFSARNSIFRNNNGNNYPGEINYCNAEGIQGGEGNIDADPMFADPDNGDFTLTRFSPCVDAGDPNAELDPDGTVADMGAFTLHQTFHRIPMHSGWNIISTFNQPRDAIIRSVWGAIVGRGNLTLTKDQSGRFYNPAIGADGFSNMQPWDVRQGYMARLMRTDTLVTLNVPVEVNTPIPLHQGWNICAYFPEEDLTAAEAFVNLGDDLVMVKDEIGRFCRPSIRFSNMGRLTRGKGYQINVARDVELVYPNAEQMAGRTGLRTRPPEDDLYSTGTEPRPTDLVHFVHTEMTGANMSVLIADYGLRIGELGEISAFTKEGLCVGSATFRNLQSEIRIGLAVWGDDPTTPEIDGALEGEALDFRLWDGQAETPILLKWTEGAGVYQSDGFAMGEITGERAGTPVLPTIVKLYEAYPNPFNSVTSVRFDLPQAGKVMLNVRDIAGREVAKLAEGDYAAGSHVVAWQADGVPTGVYLVRLVTAGSIFTTRAVIVK